MTEQYRMAAQRLRNTKIVATLGPATDAPETIAELARTGVDVFRLNFSHGDQAAHAKLMQAIRDAEFETGRCITALADMQGPKLRLGTFVNDEITIAPGQKMRFELDQDGGNEERLPLPHPEIFDAIEPGTQILMDDGKVRSRIVEVGKDWAVAEIIAGRKLSNRKGVNVPNAVLPLSALTEKDRADLEVALDLGADWVAMSFVQRPEDVELGQRLIGQRAALMAKMEKPAAIDHLDAILSVVDGLMVARGDLGVEMPAEDVPGLQKRMVRAARHVGKPVIVATQMLESMISAPTPTRAEASDVATAVFDGADAVMLSAETAVGSYPMEAVSIMDRICQRVEHDGAYPQMMALANTEAGNSVQEAITSVASTAAEQVDAACIVTFTSSGSTTIRASRQRPTMPVVCLTPHQGVARRLMLAFAVQAVVNGEMPTVGDYGRLAVRLTQQHGFAQPGQRIVVTAGIPFGKSGTTNMLRIIDVGSD